jgi:hypothetical protein
LALDGCDLAEKHPAHGVLNRHKSKCYVSFTKQEKVKCLKDFEAAGITEPFCNKLLRDPTWGPRARAIALLLQKKNWDASTSTVGLVAGTSSGSTCC